MFQTTNQVLYPNQLGLYIYILENDVYHCKVLIVSKKNIKMILSWLVSMYPNYSQLIAKGNSPETLNPLKCSTSHPRFSHIFCH